MSHFRFNGIEKHFNGIEKRLQIQYIHSRHRRHVNKSNQLESNSDDDKSNVLVKPEKLIESDDMIDSSSVGDVSSVVMSPVTTKVREIAGLQPDTEGAMTDSDSDEVPELVESSDEETSNLIPDKPNKHYAELWLKKSERFLDKQESHIHIFSLGPFLLAINTFVTKPWINALKDLGLLEKYRENEMTALSWEELASVDLVEHVYFVMQKKLRKQSYLVVCLDLIDDVEQTETLDIENALQKADKFELIKKLWERMLKSPICNRRERQTKFAVIYIAKLYHILVFGVGRDSKDIGEEFRKTRKKRDTIEPSKYKDAGNEQYQRGNFETALDYYTKAARADPFNHIYFGNRAQSHSKLKKHEEALADSRRAVTLRTDYCKGHYRYAQAYSDLGKLDFAIAVNKRGLVICSKSRSKYMNETNLTELEQQGKKLNYDRETKIREERIKRVLEEPGFADNYLEEELPAELRNLPGRKRVIKLSDAMRVLGESTKFSVDIPDYLPSDTSSDEEDQKIQRDSSKSKNNKKVRKDTNDVPKSQTKSEEIQVQTDVIDPLENVNNSKDQSEDTNRNNQGKQKKKKGDDRKNNGKKTEDVPKPLTDPPKNMRKESSPEINKDAKELKQILMEGYNSYLSGLGKNAMSSYDSALKMISKFQLKTLEIDEQDLVAVKYAYGISASSTKMYKLILEGIEKFNEICSSHSDVRFPLACYGLADAFITLNRFIQAVEPLKQGIRMVENLQCITISWPGTNCIMEESIPEKLLERMKEMLKLALYPPQPDATCRVHSDNDDDRTVIYFSDPDFKGFVRVVCQAKCTVEFHNNCWKTYKSAYGEKVVEKDMLEKPCPTPSCETPINKISIFRQDATTKILEVEREENAKKPGKKKKPTQKMPPSSQDKIQKKIQKKEQRIKRKQENKEADLINDTDEIIQPETNDDSKASVATGGDMVNVEDKDIPVIDHTKPVSVLRKDDEDAKLNKYKGTKKQKNAKKKKEKVLKQTIPVEVNFTDEKEKHLLNEHSVPDVDNTSKDNGDFSVPTLLQEKVQTFETTLGRSSPVQRLYDDITENLFSFFEDLLKAHGPLHVNDTKITSMIEDFPKDAKEKIELVGGLSRFLKQSFKFALIDDMVCLMKDAVKAREISIARGHARKSLKSENETIVNPWKTVGKLSLMTKSESPSEVKQSIPSLTSFIENSSGISQSQNIMTSEKTFVPDVKINSNPYSSSSVDSLDDFGSVPKKGSISALDDDFDVGLPKSGSRMNSIDEIDLIPLSNTRKKKSKHKICLKDLDDIDSLSDSESESGTSDQESINSDFSSSRSATEMISVTKSQNETKAIETRHGVDLSSISRSSSKSDLSEKSGSDVSSDLMAKAYKTSQLDSRSPVVSPAVISKEREHHNVDSPTTVNENRKFGMNNTLQGLNVPQPLKIPPQFNPKSAMTIEASIAAGKEKNRVDTELVNEIANDVVDRLYSGKNVSATERSEAFNRVTEDIWKDFRNADELQSMASMWPAESKSTYSQFRTSSMDYTQRKTYAEQFMKNHYQKNTTDPFGKQKQSFQAGSTSIYPNFPYPSKPPISNSNNFSASQENCPHPLSMPVSSQPQINKFPSIHSSGISQSIPSLTPSIWSSTSNTINGKQISTFSTPPPLNIPSLSDRPSPFGNISFGTSVAGQNLPNSSSLNQNTFGMCTQTDQGIQACIETKDTESNTDPYEPLKEEYVKVQQQCQSLEHTISVMKQSMQAKDALLKEKSLKIESLEADVKGFNKERKGMDEKQRLFSQEINCLKIDLNSKATLELELKQKINETEQRCLEIQKQQSDERLRSSEAVKDREELQRLRDEESQRAKRAETELLQVKKSFVLQMLERSKMEYMIHKQRLATIVKRLEEENKGIPVKLQQAIEHGENIGKKCDAEISRLKSDFEDAIRQIQEGKKLSELSEIFIPPPPPQPQPMPPIDLLTGQSGPGTVSSGAPSLTALASGSLTKSATAPQLSTSSQSTSNILPSSVPSIATLPQPKPLGLPTGVSGIAPRPLLNPTMNPMMHPATHIPGSIATTTKMSNFDKLIMKLLAAFPHYNRAIFTQLIQELRTNRGGSLSGMTLDEIVQQITELIHLHERKQGRTPSVAVTPQENPSKETVDDGGKGKEVTPPGSSSVTFQGGDTTTVEVFEEEEDPCVICHEEMTPPTTVMLECKHRFHDECIRKWLREQSTCPNCRIYALLPDEFPSLR